VPYKGVACSLRNAKSGQYGGVRNFWLVSRGKLSGAAAGWVKWIRSAQAKKIIAQNWVPLK
jgi:phosphate transport system substrate-binding protein